MTAHTPSLHGGATGRDGTLHKQIAKENGIDPDYSLPGVLQFLQSEWRRFESDRALWEIERDSLKSKIAILEGERRALEFTENDLLKRIKVLELALRNERAKKGEVAANPSATETLSTSVVPNPSAGAALASDSDSGESVQRLTNYIRNRMGTLRSREILQDYLRELSILSSTPSSETRPHTPQSTGSSLPKFSSNSSPNRQSTQNSGRTAALSADIPKLSRRRKCSPERKSSLNLPGGSWSRKEKPGSKINPWRNGVSATIMEPRIPAKEVIRHSFFSPTDNVPSEQSIPELEEDESKSTSTASTLKPQDSENTSSADETIPCPSDQTSASLIYQRSLSQESVTSIAGGPDPISKSPTSPGPIQEETLATDIDSSFGSHQTTSLITENTPAADSQVASASSEGNGQCPESRLENTEKAHLYGRGNYDTASDSDGLREVGKGVSGDSPAVCDSKEETSDHPKRWRLRFTLRNHLDSVFSVAFHASCSWLASTSLDGAVRLWDLTSRMNTQNKRKNTSDLQPFTTYRGHSSGVTSVEVDPQALLDSPGKKVDGRNGQRSSYTGRLFSGGMDGNIKVWKFLKTPPYSNYDRSSDLGTLVGHKDVVWGLRHHPLESLLASFSADGTVKLWNTSDELDLESSLAMTIPDQGAVPTAIGISQQSSSIFVGYRDSVVRRFDLVSGSLSQSYRIDRGDRLKSTAKKCEKSQSVRSGSRRTQINCLAMIEDQNLLVTGDECRFLTFFDMRSGEMINLQTGHTDSVTSIARVDNKLVTGGHDGSLRFWDLRSKLCVQDLLNAHRRKGREAIWDLSVRSEGWCASAGADGVVKVFVC